MLHRKEIVTAAGTLAIAIAIGFVMQSSETAKARYGQDARPPIAAQDVGNEVVQPEENATLLLAVQSIELTQAVEPVLSVSGPDADVQRVSAPAGIEAPAPVQDFVPQIDACDLVADGTSLPGAMVRLSLKADCFPNERLTVHHNGMMFTETTDEAGQLEVVVPALSTQAVFIMAFSNGDGAVAQVEVPDLADYERIALQWRGHAGFQLHAREFGAGYDAPGHVWIGADQDQSAMEAGQSGYVMRLGDRGAPEPLMAEIYTYPAASTARDGVIDMTVEAEVTQANCGVEAEAQSLELLNGAVKTRDLTLSMPSCDAIGNFLVLNNLVSDLKVARN